MAARATGTGTISFGLVSIPVKLYPAVSPRHLSFHMLHGKCGNRVRMQYFCPHDEEVVSRRDLVRGFEYARDQLVRFTDEELHRLEAERSDRVDIVEFVPEQSVDLAYVADTHYVGPGKGGDRAYKLLADAMARTRRVAIGRYGARGREQLVMLRPHKGGLIMHQVHYGDEVRPMEEVEYPRSMAFRESEAELADRLVQQLSVDSFDPSRYPDEYQRRVLSAVEEKVAGREVTAAPPPPPAPIMDLFEALRRSLAGGARPAAASEAAPRGAEPRPGLRKAEPR
ncbi:MAG: Ku protein, partial [Polyangiaceae bacterium]|nr:Ku protein [Polyangiaceae bacterium]